MFNKLIPLYAGFFMGSSKRTLLFLKTDFNFLTSLDPI